MKNNLSRRDFIQRSLAAGIGLAALKDIASFSTPVASGMKLGLCTYLWGQNWDLPTLISNCEKTGYLGIVF